MRELDSWPTVHKAAEREEVFPGITAHLAPGHTPGHLVFVMHAAERDVIFAGDAAKNRAELVSGTTDMTYDPAVSKASIDAIWAMWRKRPGNIVVPGHDVPMVAGKWRDQTYRQARSRDQRLVRGVSKPPSSIFFRIPCVSGPPIFPFAAVGCLARPGAT
jgi:glyoxylase-like metal-dependent hydrolase (beta-lactamase superfamily II)